MDAEMDGYTHRDEIIRRSSPGGCHRAPPTTGSTLLGRRASGSGPVYAYDELADDPQVAHNGSFVTYDHPTEGTVTTPGFPYSVQPHSRRR